MKLAVSGKGGVGKTTFASLMIRTLNAEGKRVLAIDAGISELNGRETLTWSNQKIGDGYQGDANLFPLMDTHLGDDYGWEEADGPDAGGGTLIFQQKISVALTRSVSTTLRPGTWSR